MGFRYEYLDVRYPSKEVSWEELAEKLRPWSSEDPGFISLLFHLIATLDPSIAVAGCQKNLTHTVEQTLTRFNPFTFEAVEELFDPENGFTFTETHTSGSRREGVSYETAHDRWAPEWSDIDMMLEVDVTEGELAGMTAVPTENPGFYQLQLASKVGETRFMSTEHIKPRLAGERFDANDVAFVRHSVDATVYRSWDKNDVVVSLLFADWQAEDYRARQRYRGFITPEMVDKVASTPAFLVPKGHPGTVSELRRFEFRLSASRQECILMRMLSPHHRQCLVVLKMCNSLLGRRAQAVRSYYLKTCLFWTLEEMTEEQIVGEENREMSKTTTRERDVRKDGREESVTKLTRETSGWRLFRLARLVISRLVRCVHDGNLPCFFMDRINILDTHSEVEMRELEAAARLTEAALVSIVHLHVVGLLLEFDDYSSVFARDPDNPPPPVSQADFLRQHLFWRFLQNRAMSEYRWAEGIEPVIRESLVDAVVEHGHLSLLRLQLLRQYVFWLEHRDWLGPLHLRDWAAYLTECLRITEGDPVPVSLRSVNADPSQPHWALNISEFFSPENRQRFVPDMEGLAKTLKAEADLTNGEDDNAEQDPVLRMLLGLARDLCKILDLPRGTFRPQEELSAQQLSAFLLTNGKLPAYLMEVTSCHVRDEYVRYGVEVFTDPKVTFEDSWIPEASLYETVTALDNGGSQQ